MTIFSLKIWRRDSGNKVGYCEKCGCWVLIDNKSINTYTCHFCQTEYDVYVVKNRNKTKEKVVLLPMRNIHEEVISIFKDLQQQGAEIYSQAVERGI
jgi:hypothetical protein